MGAALDPTNPPKGEPMSTQSVAEKLVSLCREGKNIEALDSLYGEDVVSHEPSCAPNPVTTGKAAVRKKSEEWLASVEEFHSGEVSDPVVADKHFSCSMSFDVTFKERGRMQMDEICVFEVKDDKMTRSSRNNFFIRWARVESALNARQILGGRGSVRAFVRLGRSLALPF